MELDELTQLISVREFLSNNRGAYNIQRDAINDLDNILFYLDRKIVNIIRSQGFKTYIGCQEKQAPEPTIKSGIQPK